MKPGCWARPAPRRRPVRRAAGVPVAPGPAGHPVEPPAPPAYRETRVLPRATPDAGTRAPVPAAALAAGLAVLAAALAGCGASGAHSDEIPPTPHPAGRTTPAGDTVVYRITGRGTASSVRYLDYGASGGSREVTERNVRLPWSRTVTVPAGGERAVALVVDLTGIGGAVHQDSITVDGSVLTEGSISGTGSDHSDLSGTFGG